MYSHKAGWTLVFILQSLLYEHLATDMSLLPSLIVQIRQHKEYFQGWQGTVSTFGTFWLVLQPLTCWQAHGVCSLSFVSPPKKGKKAAPCARR